LLKLSKLLKNRLFLVFLVFQGSFSADIISDSLKGNIQTTLAERFFNESQFDSSEVYYKKASDTWQSTGQINYYVDARIGTAKSLVRLGTVKEASTLLADIEQIHIEKKCRQCSHMGTVYSMLAYCFFASEEFSVSIVYAEKSIEYNTYTVGVNHEQTASAYYMLGLGQKAKGDYKKSIEAFNTAYDIRYKLFGEKNNNLANTLTMIGTVYDDQNKFDNALTYYQHALKILETLQLQSTSDAATNHIYTMSSLFNRGDFVQAIEHGKRAIEIYQSLSLPEHANVASAYAKLGEMYTALGDFEKAKDHLLHSLDIFVRKYPQKLSAVGGAHILLGEVYNNIGMSELAISSSEKGILLFEQAFGQYHPQVGFRYEQLAGIYFNTKHYDDAIRYYRKAITARERVTDSLSRNDLSSLHASIGKVYISKGKCDSALSSLQMALKIEKHSQEKNILQSAILQQRFGELALHQKMFDKALNYYQKALFDLTVTSNSSDVHMLPSEADIEKSIYKREILNVITGKADIFEQLFERHSNLGDLISAFNHYTQSLNILDDVRKQYSSDASKFYLAELGASLYRKGCRTALQLYEKTKQQKYLEQAFVIADRSKGNVLLERLFDGNAKRVADIPDSILHVENELLNRIAYLETAISRLSESNEIKGVLVRVYENEHFELKQKHQALIELLEKKYPKYYALKYAKYSFSLGEVQHHLADDEMLVEYFIDEKKIYLFSVSKTSLSLKKVNGTEHIGRMVRQFSSSLKTIDAELYRATGSELYVSLVKPLNLDRLQTKKLIIVPDGFLHYIPFEALPMSKSATGSIDFTKLEYLISQYDISYSYSASFDLTQQKKDAGHIVTSPSFAGFAPVFKDSSKNSDVFANRTFAEESGISDVRSITLDGKKFNELKYSENEIVSISNTLKNHQATVKNFLHTSASEKNFKFFSPLYDIVHIATHGFINEKNPKLSAVIFSQPQTTSEDDDGILYLNETCNLNLKAQLVVLSSCESGIGQLIHGEGMIALSRGLLYAGAKNIIFSLWKVSDKQTYALMDELYKNIAEGKSYASSLRLAKLSMIRSQETSFPGKWSGFVLIGK